jgi:hypothetical protein
LLSDASGRLRSFPNPSGLNVISGKIVSGSAIVPPNGLQFVSLAQTLLGSSIGNFNNLRLLATLDPIFDEDQFGLDVTDIEFVQNSMGPLKPEQTQILRLEHAQPFDTDPRLATEPNFQFLPPVVRAQNTPTLKSLGNYSPLAANVDLETLVDSVVSSQKSAGYSRVITMDPTSHEQNTLSQIFEIESDGTLTKLDVIAINFSKTNRRVYLAGKVVQDGDDFKFLNVFVLEYR